MDTTTAALALLMLLTASAVLLVGLLRVVRSDGRLDPFGRPHHHPVGCVPRSHHDPF